jgi:hypothetical protein
VVVGPSVELLCCSCSASGSWDSNNYHSFISCILTHTDVFWTIGLSLQSGIQNWITRPMQSEEIRGNHDDDDMRTVWVAAVSDRVSSCTSTGEIETKLSKHDINTAKVALSFVSRGSAADSTAKRSNTKQRG